MYIIFIFLIDLILHFASTKATASLTCAALLTPFFLFTTGQLSLFPDSRRLFSLFSSSLSQQPIILFGFSDKRKFKFFPKFSFYSLFFILQPVSPFLFF
ncbi:unnamed protein product [Meloidogyne enterolobii]|uniref:Uncharacterized protein n=2 Tax=Meloidogyne enterolobii TaxID=390850 RepID=A0A6V7XJA0_MELEN|nr:unnamed protein product [Meloidogyne enterolobii]